MKGRAGNDRYYVDHARDKVVEAAGGGTDRIFAAVTYALADGVEVEVLSATDAAGTLALNFMGNAFAQSIVGNAGNNTLDGKGGADTMTGLAGNDRYWVDNALDRVVEAAGGGTDRVFASLSYALAGNDEVEFLSTTDAAGTGGINLTGNGRAQTLTGNAGNNTLDGKGGADTMTGLAGNDRYWVDNALDKVVEAAGGGTDRVFASVNYTLAGNADIEILSTTDAAGTAGLRLTGNALAQTINGNAGNNVLDGGNGSDTLRGYAGKDTFAFTTKLGAGNIDTIVDFNVADDTIRLENSVFTGLAAGGLAASAFFAGTAAQDASDRIIYNALNGGLFFDKDGTGSAAAVQFASLSTGLAMTNKDFVVV